jgi:hypothetical protein
LLLVVLRSWSSAKESLGGAIQIDSIAREVRYWLDQLGNLQTGWQGSRQRAFLHPSSLLFKVGLLMTLVDPAFCLWFSQCFT